LPSGKVLILGGGERETYASAEVYDPATETFASAGTMTWPRESHTATLLPNGQILIAGGANSLGPTASAEIYDPAAGTSRSTGAMSVARFSHLAVALADGKVLVVGGITGASNEVAVASAELYDPATGEFSPTGNMTASRYADTATLLPNGPVLVAGGGGDGTYLASAELFDPRARTFAATGGMTVPRWSHTSTLLADGIVLLAGGESNAGFDGVLASAELYDPKAQTFAATGNMTTARLGHTATFLSNGMVLIAGGTDGTGISASAELYQ
jgi:hypothetical protein